MPRSAQIALKLFLSLIGVIALDGSSIEKWIFTAVGLSVEKTDFFYWLLTLGIALCLYIIFTLIGIPFRWMDHRMKRAVQSGLRPIGFESVSRFWEYWAGAIVFVPIGWALVFMLFFGFTTLHPLMYVYFLVPFLPLAAILVLTLINIPLYIRHILSLKK